jgi:hypothetical protein
MSHNPRRRKLAAAFLGVVTAVSAMALGGAGYASIPTHSQATFAIVASVLAGCLAVKAAWPSDAATQKKLISPG